MKSFLPILLIISVVLVSACAQQSTTTTLPPTTTQGPAMAKEASLSVNDQPIVNSKVTVATVVSVGPGWLVIHADTNGAPGADIGHVAVSDGENANVQVSVDTSKVTSTLYAMLHIDAGVIGTYEFPGDDTPAKDNTGKVVNVAFKSSGTPPSTGAMTAKIIEITSAGFSPSTLTIKAGDTVTFINKDSAQHWPASAVHPTHAVYPEPGGCIGSKFDSCKNLAQNEEWSFTFNEKGTWNYHDHLNPSLFGKIVVE